MARIRLTIAGKLGDISLGNFLSILKDSHDILRELDRALSDQQHSGSLIWKVSGLGEGSAYVELSSKLVSGDRDHSTTVSTFFTGGLSQLQREGTTPPLFSTESIERVRHMVRQIGNDGIERLDIALPDSEHSGVSLTRSIEDKLKQLTGVHHKSLGAVEGFVGLVEDSPRTRRFNVYHAVTQRAVRCTLPPEWYQRVMELWKHRVIVRGEISYNVKGEPLSAATTSIRRLGKKDELPSWRDVLGLAPDFTDGQSSKEFLRVLHGS